MKRVSIIFLFILTIISYQNVIFASYNSEALVEELHQEVERVFKERSKIWNQLLMGQYVSIDEIEEDLNEFIVGPLLKLDIEMFEHMLNNPTSYEGISNVSVKSIYVVKNSLNRVKLECIMLWDISGYENEYTEEIKYIVEMENIKDRWMLSNYQISE